MSIKINYSKNTNKTSSNVVIFVNEKFNLGPIKKFLSKFEISYIRFIENE